MATFAEAYNGRGYHDKGMASPYVFSGTSVYDKGKYVEINGRAKFKSNLKDKQPGVILTLHSILSH